MKGFIETVMNRARPLRHREAAAERCGPGIARPCDPTCRLAQEARDGLGKGLECNGPGGWDGRLWRPISGGSWCSAAASGGVPPASFVSEWHLRQL